MQLVDELNHAAWESGSVFTRGFGVWVADGSLPAVIDIDVVVTSEGSRYMHTQASCTPVAHPRSSKPDFLIPLAASRISVSFMLHPSRFQVDLIVPIGEFAMPFAVAHTHHPIGGVIASPLSRAKTRLESSKRVARSASMLRDRI